MIKLRFRVLMIYFRFYGSPASILEKWEKNDRKWRRISSQGGNTAKGAAIKEFFFKNVEKRNYHRGSYDSELEIKPTLLQKEFLQLCEVLSANYWNKWDRIEKAIQEQDKKKLKNILEEASITIISKALKK